MRHGSHLRISGGVSDPTVYHFGKKGTRKDTFHPERKIFQSKVDKFNTVKLLTGYSCCSKSTAAPSEHLMRWIQTESGNSYQFCSKQYACAATIRTILWQNSTSAFQLHWVNCHREWNGNSWGLFTHAFPTLWKALGAAQTECVQLILSPLDRNMYIAVCSWLQPPLNTV